MADHDVEQPKRRLKMDLGEIEGAFESGSLEAHYYLDLETGQMEMITDEMRRDLEEVYETAYDEDGKEKMPIAQAIQQSDVPEWEKEALLIADRVEAGYGTRYISIPQSDSHEGYGDMEDFIGTVRDPHLQELLEVAIQGRGAFRRFKDVLLRYPQERERWFAFSDAQVQQRVLDWLESEGIEPIGG